MRNKKGFTLIEMLVVIAIIAVLVSIVIPTITSTTDKAKAAADAANLRSALGYMNSVLMTDEKKIDEAIGNYVAPESKYTPDAELHILYTRPGVIDVYFVDATGYYGLDYLAEVATNGVDSEKLTQIGLAKPSTGGTWYKAGSATPIG